jgi:integrase/recombinase XerD
VSLPSPDLSERVCAGRRGISKAAHAHRPHIFTDAEIARLVRAAEQLRSTPASPTRRTVFRLAVVLLYTTGLRRGELLRLTVGDYHADEQLLVRESKFHKSRLVPLSADGGHAIDAALLDRRRHGLPVGAESPLIWNRSRAGGRGYTGVGLGAGFRTLCEHAAIQTTTGARPRIHDLRHTFAVHALVRWYRAGADPQAKLPFLAAYMGHVSPISTAYYLPFVSALAGVASARFLTVAGTLITVPPLQGDHR